MKQEKHVEKKIDDSFSSIPTTLESLVNGDAEFVYSVANGVGQNTVWSLKGVFANYKLRARLRFDSTVFSKFFFVDSCSNIG